MTDRRIETAVILAAGMAVRLGERTKELPKGFLKLGDETLIERSIRLLKKNGISNIIVGVGHKGSVYEGIQEKHGLTIYHSDAYATTDSLYTLACAQSHVTRDLLILESDILYDESALETLLASEGDAVILGSGFTGAGDEVYLDANENGEFRHLTKDPSARAEAYAELVGISKVSLDIYRKMIALPTVREIPYERAFNELAATESIRVERQSDLVWCEIDNEEHLERAKREVLPRLTG